MAYNSNDPFKEFGGKAVQPSSDPFAEFGGKTVDNKKKSKAAEVAGPPPTTDVSGTGLEPSPVPKAKNVAIFTAKTKPRETGFFEGAVEFVTGGPGVKIEKEDADFLVDNAIKSAKKQFANERMFDLLFYDANGNVNTQYSKLFMNTFMANVGYKNTKESLSDEDRDIVDQRFNDFLKNQKRQTPAQVDKIMKNLSGSMIASQKSAAMEQARTPEEKKKVEQVYSIYTPKPKEEKPAKDMYASTKGVLSEEMMALMDETLIDDVNKYLLNNPGEYQKYVEYGTGGSVQAQLELIQMATQPRFEAVAAQLQVYADQGQLKTLEELSGITSKLNIYNGQMQILKKQIDAFSPKELTPEQKKQFEIDKGNFQIKDTQFKELEKTLVELEGMLRPVYDQLEQLKPLAEAGDVAAINKYNGLVNQYGKDIQSYNALIPTIKKIQEERNIAAQVVNKYAATTQDVNAFNQYKESIDKYNGLYNEAMPLINKQRELADSLPEEDLDKIFDLIKQTGAIIDFDEKSKKLGDSKGEPFVAFYSGNPIMENLIVPFGESYAEWTLKGVSGVFKAGSNLVEFLSGASDDYYSSFDHVSDVILKGYDLSGDTWTNNILPGYKVKDFRDPLTGDIIWTPQSVVVGTAEQLGLVATMATSTGFLRSLGMAANSSVVLPMFFATYEDNIVLAKELGYVGSEAQAAGTLFSLIEGASELLMPDISLFQGGAKNQLFSRFMKNYMGKGRKAAINDILVTSLKEYGEEVTVELARILTTLTTSSVGGQNQQYTVTGADLFETFVFTTLAAGAPSAVQNISMSTKSFNNAMKFEMAKDLEGSIQMIQTYNNLGKIDNVKANKLVTELKAISAVQGQLPADLIEPKRIAISNIYAGKAELQKLLDDINISPEIKAGIKKMMLEADNAIANIMMADDTEFSNKWNSSIREETDKVMEVFNQEMAPEATEQEMSMMDQTRMEILGDIFGDTKVQRDADSLEQRMANAEEISIDEINKVLDGLYAQVESIMDNYFDNPAGKQYAQSLLDKIDKLKSYEFATGTKTDVITERKAVQTARAALQETASVINLARAPRATATITSEDGATGTYSIEVGPDGAVTFEPVTVELGKVTDDEYQAFLDNAEVSNERILDIARKSANNQKLNKKEQEIFNAKANEINQVAKKLKSQSLVRVGNVNDVNKTASIVETTLNEQGLPQSVTFSILDENGAKHTIKVEAGKKIKPQQLLDLAINIRANEIGTVDPTAFDEAFEEVTRETITKTYPNAVQEQTAGQVPVQPEAGTRQEMAEGKPQAEPQAPAQEGEKVTPKVAERKPTPSAQTLREAAVRQRMDKAVQILAKSFEGSGVTVNIIEDEAEYDAIVGDPQGRSNGIFNSEDGRVIINPKRMNLAMQGMRVLFHESTHPVLNILYNTDRALYDKVLKGMKDSGKKGMNIWQDIVMFGNRYANEGYSPEQVDNEMLTESIGRIINGEIGLNDIPVGWRQQFVDMLNKIAKMLGIKPIGAVTDAGRFRDFAASLKDAFEQGKNIAGIVGQENVTKYQSPFVDEQLTIMGIDQQQFLDKTTQMAQQVEGMVVPGSLTNGWIQTGTKNGEPIVKFVGEATLENIRINAPDSYVNRAYELAQYPLSGIDVKGEFIKNNNLNELDEKTRKLFEKSFVHEAKKSMQKILDSSKLNVGEKDSDETIANKKKAKALLKTLVSSSIDIDTLYDSLVELGNYSENVSTSLITSLYQKREFVYDDKVKEKIARWKDQKKRGIREGKWVDNKIAETVFAKRDKEVMANEAESIYKDMKQKVKDNLKFIYDLVNPAIRNLTKLWYDGANVIAQEFGQQYELSLEQTAGIIASQSPQMPWFSNLHLAQAIMDIMKNKGGEVFTKEQFDYYVNSAKKYPKQIAYIPTVKSLIGKRLDELSDYDAGIFVRSYYDLNMSRKAPKRLPSGVIVSYETSDSSFSSYDTIEKGVSIFRDGSTENISVNLGEANKVRNFYNNIVDPTNINSVTIDTHAMAVSLIMPFGASDTEIKFDSGSYAFYSDSYNELARELGIGARELQSITWEAIRAFFPDNIKTAKFKGEIGNIWKRYSTGEINIDQARNEILNKGQDANKTEWSDSIQDWMDGKTGTDYFRPIDRKGDVPGTAVGRGGERVGGGVSPMAGGDIRQGGDILGRKSGIKGQPSLMGEVDYLYNNKNEQFYFTNIDVPNGFTILLDPDPSEYEQKNYGPFVELYDQFGYRISKGKIDEIKQEIKDNYPIGTPNLINPTMIDLYTNIDKFTLKQIGLILQKFDPEGEWSNMDKEVNDQKSEYEARKKHKELLAYSRKFFRDTINEFFSDGMSSDDEFGYDIKGDGLGAKVNPRFIGKQFSMMDTKPIMADVVNGFYSPIENRIMETKVEKQSANKWLGMVGKGDEAVYTGVKGWLESKNPQEQVSKKDILDFMKNNRVEVREVVLTKKETARGRFESPSQPLVLPGEEADYKEVLVVLPIAEGIKFQSSHFPQQPNILVHLRMNIRTDANDNKVLFLEEVQSDWGQKGKKEGFDLSKEEVSKKYEEANNNLNKIEKSIEEKYGKDWDLKGDIEDVLTPDEYIKYQNAATERAKWGNSLGKDYLTGAPAAPFVTDTNAWTKLALKIALKEAIKQNADAIAWTTGEQQNGRFDLSKQVKEIEYIKRGNKYKLGITGINGEGIELPKSEFTDNELEGVVGKEVAQKIINGEGKRYNGHEGVTLEGEDLKIGGKGMIGFYGSVEQGKEGIVGSVAKALVKELTGQQGVIETTVIKQKDIKVDFANPKFKSDYAIFQDGKLIKGYYKTKEAAQEEADRMISQTASQPSIAITPELKQAVRKGMPQFSLMEVEKPNQPTLAAAGLTPSQVAQWKKDNKVSQREGRITEVQKSAQDLYEGKITVYQHIENVRKSQPARTYESVPKLPAYKEIASALAENQMETGIIGLNKGIPKGTQVGARLDIPSFNNYGVNVVSIHEATGSGKAIGYGRTASLSNVKFKTSPSAALKVAMGESKGTWARMVGTWNNESEESVVARAKEGLKSGDMIQIGINPFRHSWFYNRKTGMPIMEASEVIQVGNMVLASGVRELDLNNAKDRAEFEDAFKVKLKSGKMGQFSLMEQTSKQAAKAFPKGQFSMVESTVMSNPAEMAQNQYPLYQSMMQLASDAFDNGARDVEAFKKYAADVQWPDELSRDYHTQTVWDDIIRIKEGKKPLINSQADYEKMLRNKSKSHASNLAEIAKKRTRRFKEVAKKRFFDSRAEWFNALARQANSLFDIVAAYTDTIGGMTEKGLYMADMFMSTTYDGLSQVENIPFNGQMYSERRLFDEMLTLIGYLETNRKMQDKFDEFIDLETQYLNEKDPNKKAALKDKRDVVKEYLERNRVLLGDGKNIPYSLKDFTRSNLNQAAAERKLTELSLAYPELYNKLWNRADAYFKAWETLLGMRLDAGMLSQESYDEMKKYKYVPTRFLGYLLMEVSDETDAKLPESTGSQIERLKGGSEEELVMAHDEALKFASMSVTRSIQKNKAVMALSRAIDANPNNITFWKPEVSKRDRFGNATEWVYDKKKFGLIKYYVDGKIEAIATEQLVADSFNGRQEGFEMPEGLGYVFMSTPFRMVTTNLNPGFGLAQIVIDLNQALLTNEAYASITTGAIPLLLKDIRLLGGLYLGTASKWMGLNFNLDKEWQQLFTEAREYGGLISFTQAETFESALEKAAKPQGKMSKVGNAFALGREKIEKLNTSMEYVTRLAVFGKMKKNLINEYKKNNNGMEPKGQALEDILTKAAATSMNTLNYNRGGSVIKPLNRVMAYLNVGFQVPYSIYRYAKKSPYFFALKVSELAVYGALLPLLLYSLLDDDDKDKYLEYYNRLSPFEKSNYWHFPNPFRNPNDPDTWILRFKKPGLLLPIINTTEVLAMYSATNGKTQKPKEYFTSYPDQYTASLTRDFYEAQPFKAGIISSMPTLNAAMIGFGNLDLYRMENVVENEELKANPREGLDDPRVGQFYKYVSQIGVESPYLTDGLLSPKRMDASVKALVGDFTKNPITAYPLFATGELMNGLSGYREAGKYVPAEPEKDIGDKLIEGSGFTQRFTTKIPDLKPVTRKKMADQKSEKNAIYDTVAWTIDQVIQQGEKLSREDIKMFYNDLNINQKGMFSPDEYEKLFENSYRYSIKNAAIREIEDKYTWVKRFTLSPSNVDKLIIWESETSDYSYDQKFEALKWLVENELFIPKKEMPKGDITLDEQLVKDLKKLKYIR